MTPAETSASADPLLVDPAMAAIAAKLRGGGGRPLVVGICGAQGSGKSTLAAALASALDHGGVATAILSLDDLYKTRDERIAMGGQLHPLLRTRGVPGTHDVALGECIIAALAAGRPVALPRFDKAADDRADPAAWPIASADTRVLLFEGWCVGARPQPDAALGPPINALERDEDGDGVWRCYANAALSGYRALFGRIDLLLLLAAPSFDVVQAWRTQQEQALRARTGGGMRDEEIARFVQHYERLTQHILRDMPGYADLTIRLDEQRGVLAVEKAASAADARSDPTATRLP